MKKKKPPLPLKPLPNVPFLYHQSSSSPSFTHSSVRSSQSSLRRMQYFTDFSKQQQRKKKKKKNSRGFTPLFKIKKAAFALVRLPQQGNKHSYNLLRSKAIDRSRPCVGSPAPRPTGTRQPRKSLCSPKSTSYMFYRENRRGICLLVKFTIQSSESVRMTRQLG